jgi:sugar-specific transcriptional regulator TrmB
MAKKKQTLDEVLPVEENVQEVQEEVLEEAPQIEENDTTIEEEPVSQEEPVEEETVDPEKVIEEFSEAAKNIDSFVTNTTTQEELTEKLENELNRASNVEEKLEKQIADLEKKVSPEMKKGFTQFWMGTSEGWFN